MRAEKDLEGYQAKLRSMAREISLSEERTRRRAAVDLHDSIGQNLAVARITTGKLLAAKKYDADALHKLQELIDKALRGTRYVIADLSPAVLYELGLVPAIKSLAERFEPTNNVRCNVVERGTPWPLSDDLKVELYRVVRELLNNVSRHADAEAATVTVDWTPAAVDLTVEDNGVGFVSDVNDTNASDMHGFGLFNVREGIQLLGGRISFESSRGIGTRVDISVPRVPVGSDS
jgi:signal transduction histidine kinase